MAKEKYEIKNIKRKFRSNQYTTTATDEPTAAHNVICECLPQISSSSCILSNCGKIFKNILAVNICEAGLQLLHDEMKKMGFSLLFSITCKTVALKINFFLLQILKKTNQR